VSPMPTFDGLRWSSGGANVLLSGSSATVLVRPEKRIFASTTLPPRFALWSPDGSQALFGSDPNGAAWDVIAWDGQKMGASVELASGLRSGAFSFDGGYLASIYDDGLRMYQCSRDTATSGGLITREQAKQVIQRSGALIKVNLEDSKLIRWADISGMLTGTWAVVRPEASGIEPTAPVWLLMYAGEAKQPAGANLESTPGVRSPTVNLVLYVLDAKTGKELGARVASGTWWIGQPFESLTDRASDPTPHPFERPQSSIPPMPTPRPTPSPTTSSAAAGVARVESAPGWLVAYPLRLRGDHPRHARSRPRDRRVDSRRPRDLAPDRISAHCRALGKPESALARGLVRGEPWRQHRDEDHRILICNDCREGGARPSSIGGTPAAGQSLRPAEDMGRSS